MTNPCQRDEVMVPAVVAAAKDVGTVMASMLMIPASIATHFKRKRSAITTARTTGILHRSAVARRMRRLTLLKNKKMTSLH